MKKIIILICIIFTISGCESEDFEALTSIDIVEDNSIEDIFQYDDIVDLDMDSIAYIRIMNGNTGQEIFIDDKRLEELYDSLKICEFSASSIDTDRGGYSYYIDFIAKGNLQNLLRLSNAELNIFVDDYVGSYRLVEGKENIDELIELIFESYEDSDEYDIYGAKWIEYQLNDYYLIRHLGSDITDDFQEVVERSAIEDITEYLRMISLSYNEEVIRAGSGTLVIQYYKEDEQVFNYTFEGSEVVRCNATFEVNNPDVLEYFWTNY